MSALEQVIPEGYKQTEVGIIPEDWEIDSIGNLVSITTGNKNTQDRVNDGLYPFFVRSQTVERINSFSFDGEGVLTAGDGVGTGKIFHYMNGKFDFHQRVYLMYNFGEKLFGYYFYIYFSNNFYDRIMSMTAKSSVDSVRREMISEMKVSLPPYDEQTAIANALSDVDALLTELEKLIAKKQAIKTATMQQLLTGKTRLPQFATYTEGEKQGQPKGTKPSELGEIPENWDVSKLGDLGKFKNGINKDADSFGHGSPFVNLMDVFGKPKISGIEDFGLINSTALEKKEYSISKGDVLFIRSSVKPSGVGLTSVALANIDNAVYSGFLIRFRSNKKLDDNFKIHCFYDESFRKRIIAASTVSANTNINQDALKEIQIAYPTDIDEQIAIATILSDMDNEIQTLEQRLAKTSQIKQGMMQELLTGRTRLPFDNE